MLIRIGRTLLVVFLMFSGHLLMAANYTFVVAQDGSGNFTSIQKAIDACKAFPDNRITIFVKNGIYKNPILYADYMDYGAISMIRNNSKLEIHTVFCKQADKSGKGEITASKPVDSSIIYFRVEVRTGDECSFSYSTDGVSFSTIGSSFKAREGRWIGAKLSFYALRNGVINDAGSADIDWFRIDK